MTPKRSFLHSLAGWTEPSHIEARLRLLLGSTVELGHLDGLFAVIHGSAISKLSRILEFKHKYAVGCRVGVSS